MKLCVVGSGYVGLVSGACFAETGNDVVCFDIDADKIDKLRQGIIPIFEPGLGELVDRNVAGGRLEFSTDAAAAIAGAQVVFVAVGTPSRSDGAADLQAVDRVAEMVAQHVTGETVLVLKSTVPVGTNARARRIVEGAPHRIHVVSNPEFLKEGDALADFMRPDRIVIGCDEDDELARDVMSRLYHPVTLHRERIIWMDPASAELTKYVANTMLAMRISFMNEVAALCEKVGADVHKVRQGVGSDERIGPKFLYAGPGYGGSCLAGRETVVARQAGRTRLIRLDHLFEELAADGDPDATIVQPEGIDVLSWSDGEPRFVPCTAVTRRRYEGEMIDVRTKMGRRVRCTTDHPFVVLDPTTGEQRVVLAEALSATDWLPLAVGEWCARDRADTGLDLLDRLPEIGVPRDDVIVRVSRDEASLLDRTGSTIVADRIAGLEHPRGRERAYDILTTHTVRLAEAECIGLDLERCTLGTCKNGTYAPRCIPLDERFWRIVGLYLAEGHCTTDGRRRRLAWSFHPSAEPDLVEEVASFWRGLGVKTWVHRTATTMQVSVSSRLLAGLFIDALRLGANCYDHRIPSLIWDAPPAHVVALLSGLWQGDGSWSFVGGGPSVVLEYGTVSRTLADGMLRLLARLGIVARLKIQRHRKSTVPSCHLVIAGAEQIERAIALVKRSDREEALASISRQQKRIAPTGYRRVAGGTCVRVVSLERSFHAGWVYSLEAPGTNTFVTTDGLVVHNCLPKDVAALVHTGREHGVELEMAAAADRVNQRQKGTLARKLKHDHFGGDLRGKRICVWGIAFKPRTDDIREAPALQLIDALLSEGAVVAAHDPEALEQAKRRYGERVELHEDAYEAAKGADALVLVTEWREYQNPDFPRLLQLMKKPILLDGRNIWAGYRLREQGFSYAGIGVRGS